MSTPAPIGRIVADDLTPAEAAALLAALPNGCRVAIGVTVTRFRTQPPPSMAELLDMFAGRTSAPTEETETP